LAETATVGTVQIGVQGFDFGLGCLKEAVAEGFVVTVFAQGPCWAAVDTFSAAALGLEETVFIWLKVRSGAGFVAVFNY
jgi:hypothetical protein